MAPHDEEDLFDEEPPAVDPYATLGLLKSATADEIKTAYRKAALKHHPGKKELVNYPAMAKDCHTCNHFPFVHNL